VVTRPVVEAHQLSLWLDTGWAYRDVDLTVPPRTLAVLAGRCDGWRNPLLRTLAGELAPTGGSLTVCGYPMPAETGAARRRLAVARLPENAVADPAAVVGDCVAARLVLSDVPGDSDVFEAAADLVGFTAVRHRRIAGLSLLERLLLGIALSITTPVELVLIDDTDADLDDHERAAVWQALSMVCRAGAAVVAGAVEPPDHADQVVSLPEDRSGSIP
jgi:ABC-2 type transport system ATP-binding protein